MEEKCRGLIEELLMFGKNAGLFDDADKIFVRNSLYELLRLTGEPETNDPAADNPEEETAVRILTGISDYAAEKGLIEADTATFRDLFEARVMGLLMQKPSVIRSRFYDDYKESPKLATDNFYTLCRKSNYIQVDRIMKNLYWQTETDYGPMEITINLSKPEKDPRDIAAAKNAVQSDYPKCLLCVENVGFAGTVTHPARQNHRVIDIRLREEEWYFQYSPYVYYNEHCIVLNRNHTPMKINRQTFEKLLDFTDLFPHYFIGSNADLPIVGGSILSHDHFQGGRHIFPMEKAEPHSFYSYGKHPEISASLVKWPMSVIRLSCDRTPEARERLVDTANHILESWRAYTDEEAGILSRTTDAHNTVTPIARINRKGRYEMDIVLRNNRTSEEHPLGIFHPHADLHHIKKENIGLIEVMGLAVLPGRLAEETQIIARYLSGGVTKIDKYNPHAEWAARLEDRYGTVNSYDTAIELIRDDIGKIFARVLSDSGVFKCTDEGIAQFGRYMDSAGFSLLTGNNGG